MSTVSQVDGSLEFKKVSSSIAMTVILVSFSMLFATLFLGYAVYRSTAVGWPPSGTELPTTYAPILSTLFIALSSLAFVQLEKSKSGTWLILSIVFGVLFLFSQMGLWSDLKASGIYSGTSIFSSIIYGFTWIHAAHMVGGLACLFALIPTVYFGRATVSIENVGKFWHFLGIIWFIMYLAIFVV